jgi:hypothetical protein
MIFIPFKSNKLVTKSRKIGMGRQVARILDLRDVYRMLEEKHEGNRPLRVSGTDGRILLKWNFRM